MDAEAPVMEELRIGFHPSVSENWLISHLRNPKSEEDNLSIVDRG